MTSQSPPAARLRAVTPVGILAEKLDDLAHRLDTAQSVDDDAKALLGEARRLAGGLDSYLGTCTTPESPALALLARRTRDQNWNGIGGGAPLEQEMLSGHVEGQTLKFLVRVTNAQRVLEIGMFTGYSALAMAEGLSAGGTLVACEIDPFAAQFARQCFAQSPSGHKITIHVGPAHQTLSQLAAAGEVFDFVFIDADKAGYADYLDSLLRTTLLAPRGIVCVDNTLMQGQPYITRKPTKPGAAIAAFNRLVADDSRVEQVLLPLRDGLTLIRRADAGRKSEV